MKNIVILNKKEGETPLEALEKFRAKNTEYKDQKMTYAGRLDPMASGLLLILAGEETKNKEKYLALSKEYEFEILFGFSTDTYDLLGKVKNFPRQDLGKKELEKNIKENLKYFTGKWVQEYPIYSSKTVKGKPLFSYGRSGEEVELPKREVVVKSLKFIKLRRIGCQALLTNIKKRIDKVKGPARNAKGIAFAGGDFRQKEILQIWQKKLDKKPDNFWIGSFKIKCSSGTYVRSLAHNLGKRISTPTLAYSIKRTKIGKWRHSI